LSYKPATDDVRESPAMEFVRQLLAAGAFVRAHDPKANDEAARTLSHASFKVCGSPFAAGEDADAVAVLTEWNEFRSLELPELRARMKGNVLLDTRNIYNPRDAREAGFDYIGRGRGWRVAKNSRGRHDHP
jgi:UDPglucose 6-dehydrogenase